jgi:hypothetical protein
VGQLGAVRLPNRILLVGARNGGAEFQVSEGREIRVVLMPCELELGIEQDDA